MKFLKFVLFTAALVAMIALVIFFVSQKGTGSNNQPTNEQQTGPTQSPNVTDDENVSVDGQNNGENGGNSQIEPTEQPTSAPTSTVTPTPTPVPTPSVTVDTDPHSLTVIVNKAHALPEDYSPNDLVYPDVRFTFKDKIEKRMMRKEAAAALEKMFEGAEVDGIYLAGVSAYRSHATQTALFNRYVERDGYDKAITYSAVPGTSEHETGLAIDVSASDGKCAAQDCFGDTVEALWVANNASTYGFIVRYPEGKESITGYKYEPWHLRFVGEQLAQKITADNLTLEEYYQVVPVKQ